MSRSPRMIAAAAATLVLAVAGTAVAGKGDVRAATTIKIEAMTSLANKAILIGSIGSSKPKCLANREVRVTVVPQHGADLLVDVARTGGGGGWFALHDLDEIEAVKPTALKVAVAKRTSRLAGNRELICAGKRLRRPIS